MKNILLTGDSKGLGENIKSHLKVLEKEIISAEISPVKAAEIMIQEFKKSI